MVHSCTTCGKTYTQSGSLNRHISAAHGNKVFKCDTCSRHLSTKASLNRHRRLKHGRDFSKVEYVPYVKKEGDSSTSDSDDNTEYAPPAKDIGEQDAGSVE